MSKKIIGVTVGTTLPKPNWEQNDPTKGDYIKNKPNENDVILLAQEVGLIDLIVDKSGCILIDKNGIVGTM